MVTVHASGITRTGTTETQEEDCEGVSGFQQTRVTPNHGATVPSRYGGRKRLGELAPT